jgi:hypothetical protein
MEGVESSAFVSLGKNSWRIDLRIPVENGQLNSRHVGICECVCLSTVNFRVERVVTHGQCREEGWGMRHLVGDVVD